MKRRLLIISFIFAGLVLSGAGFKIKFAKTESGGVFRSRDRGATWLQRVFIHPSPGRKSSTIDAVDVVRLVNAKQDQDVFFLGTAGDGLYRSFNGGWTWEKTALGGARIEDIAIDPYTKGVRIVYVSLANKIFKSWDGGSTWKQIYLDPRFETRIFELAIDPFTRGIIYMGTDDGRLLISKDSGRNWSSVFNQGMGGITDILPSYNTKDLICILTGRAGVFRSEDAGITWKKTVRFSGNIIYDGSSTKKGEERIYANTNAGVFVTSDGGQTWEELPLVTKGGDVRVRGFAIHPENSNIIYYGTQRAVYESMDAGKSWEAHELPTTRAVNAIALNSKDPETVFIGAAFVKEEKNELSPF